MRGAATVRDGGVDVTLVRGATLARLEHASTWVDERIEFCRRIEEAGKNMTS